MQIEIYFEGKKKVNAKVKGYTIKTDRPVDDGGEGSAPAPFDLFLASIGTCVGVYIKGFCDQRGIPAENIKISQKIIVNPETHLVGKISLDIKLPSDFPEKYKDAMINVANLCTVKKHLMNPPEIEVNTSVL
jgi:putative redox protein